MRRRQWVSGLGFAFLVSCALVGCGGKGAGDTCTKDGECGSNLTCQSIPGRPNLDYCCATPYTMTKDAPNCQPANVPSGGNDAGGDAGHD
jgi:hypothetical protein